jgi:hypothetical protein
MGRADYGALCTGSARQRDQPDRVLPGLLVSPVRRPSALLGTRALDAPFGAVDYSVTVWINGAYAGAHDGGSTPFAFDVTAWATDSRFEIVVRAEDDPQASRQASRQAGWQLNPHSIWYPRTTGIWQTVWMERVPETRIGRIAFTPNLARWEIGVQAWLEGTRRANLRLGVKLRSGAQVLASDTYQIVAGELHRGIALSDPGIATRATSCCGVLTRRT